MVLLGLFDQLELVHLRLELKLITLAATLGFYRLIRISIFWSSPICDNIEIRLWLKK